MPVSETSFDHLVFCNHFELIFNPAGEKFTPPADTNKCVYIKDRVLQTIQKKVLLFVWAEQAVLGSAKTDLRFKYEI